LEGQGEGGKLRPQRPGTRQSSPPVVSDTLQPKLPGTELALAFLQAALGEDARFGAVEQARNQSRSLEARHAADVQELVVSVVDDDTVAGGLRDPLGLELHLHEEVLVLDLLQEARCQRLWSRQGLSRPALQHEHGSFALELDAALAVEDAPEGLPT